MIELINRRALLQFSLGAAATAMLPAKGFAQTAAPWRFGSPMAPATTYSEAMNRFADGLASQTKDRLKVTNFPSGQLGGLKEMLTAVQLGTQTMVLAAPSWLANFTKQMDVFSLPYLVASEDRLFAALDGSFGAQMAAEIEKSGFKILAWWGSGARQMMNNTRSLQTPDDMKGLKMRVISTPVWRQTMTALGANPVAVDYPEVYLALQQHTVDGFEGTPTDIVASKLYEVCQYMSLTEHVYDFYVVAMNLALWNGLPKEDQSAVTQAMQSATQWQRTAQRDATRKALDELGTHIKVNPVSEAERRKFADAMGPVYESFTSRNGKDFFNRAKAALA